MRIRQRHRVLILATAVHTSAFFVAPMASASSPGQQHSRTRPAFRLVTGPADEIVAGVGSPDGYRLFLAQSTNRWRWEPLALLDPGGENDQTWVGATCLTGDGTTAVAVIAP